MGVILHIFRKSKTPRIKRLPSTGPDTDEEKRKHMSQPVPNQLTNVEQKNKAKKRRESRRSTQGVTLDIVNDAKTELKKIHFLKVIFTKDYEYVSGFSWLF